MQKRLETKTAQPPRLLRRSLPFTILALVLATLYFAPQLPIMRGWLLSFVTGAAEAAGYNLRVGEHRGNPWSGLSLEDVDVSGLGLDISVDKLGATYYLPGLLTRTLPFSVTAEGVRGDITLGEFETSSGSGGGAAIRPVLRRLSLRDVALRATDVPYTLPDITLSELEARTNGAAPITATALLTTPEGNMNVDARVSLSPFEIVANVPRGDVRIARQWWDGIEGGTLSGEFRYGDGKIEADAVVSDGTIAFLGEEVTDISGPLRLRYPTVDADLSGQTLGGAVEATGGVDIDALRWFGEATGEVGLRDTALWLAEGRLPLDLSGIPITGRADAQVRASGWTDVNVSGVARGSGSLATYPLENLLVDFEYDTQTATRATITGELAGGEVTSQLSPTPEGFTFDLDAQDVALLETVFADLSIALTQDGILSGPTVAALSGRLLDEPVDLQINGDLTPERWFLPLTGIAFAGPFEGEISLADGLLAGDLVGSDLNFAFLDGPITLSLAANGPPTELPLNLSLSAPEPTGFAFGPANVAETIEGELTAILRGSLLDDIEGALGPLTLEGQTLLSGEEGTFSYTLNEAEVRGPLTGTFSAADGSLVLENRNLLGEAALTSSILELPGVALEPLDAALVYSFDETWQVTLADAEQGLELSFEGGALKLSTDTTPVTVAGQAISLNGDVSADASDVLGTLDFDLVSLTTLGDIAFTGDANEATFNLSSAPESEGLLNALSSVRGSVRLREGTGQFTGRLGELELFGAGDISSGGVRADITAQSGNDSLNLKLEGAPNNSTLTLRGNLPLAPVGDLVGFDLGGQVSADLARVESGYAGSATVTTELAGVPLDLVLRGEGDRLGLSGEAWPLGVPVALDGTLQPNVRITGTSEYGNVQLVQDGWQLSGGGALPDLTRAGFTLGTQAWQLAGSLPAQTLNLTLPESGSAAQLVWGESGWQLAADLNQTGTRGEAVLSLDATAKLSAENRAGSIDGILNVATPDSSSPLALDGSLADLNVSGTLPAAAASSLIDLPLALQGEVAVNAQADLLNGVSYSADLAWQTPADRLAATIEGAGSDWRLSAQATGLELALKNGVLNAQAEGFNPAAFVDIPRVRGTLSGDFSYALGQDAAERYGGTLSLTTSEPADARVFLTGTGEGVELNAELEQEEAALAASGALLPILDINVLGNLSDYATLTGRVTGAPSQPEFTAALVTTAFEIENQFSLPAQSLAVTCTLSEGLRVQVEGDALTLELIEGNLKGDLALPFSLKGDPHLLAATVGGSLGEPRAAGTLAGPLISGPVTFSDDTLASNLALNLAPWLDSVPLSNALVTVDLTALTDLSWQADVAGGASFRDLALELKANLTGQSLAYSGTGEIEVEASAVPFSLAGQGGDVQLNTELNGFDLASLEDLAPVPLSGQGNGTVNFTSADGLSFDIGAMGTVQNRAFTIEARQTAAEPLQATAVAENLQLNVEQLQTASYSVRLSSLAAEPMLDLEGVLGLSPTTTLEIAGQVRGQVITLSANYAPDTGLAAWQLVYDGATLGGEAAQAEAGWLVKSTAEIPIESNLPASGSASLQAQINGGTVDLNFLTASARLAGRDLALSLAGPAWPAPLLTGKLGVDSFDPFALSFSDTAQGYVLRAAQNGLELAGDLSSSLGLTGFTLTGAGALPLGPDLRLGSNLRWQANTGFTGQADLTGRLADNAKVQLVILGDSSLNVNGTVAYREADLVELDLSLAPDLLNNPALSGLIVVEGQLEQVLPAYSGEALGFGATLDLSGNAREPQVSGPLALRGALVAEGELALAGADGRLSLSGDGLDMRAQLSTSGWTLDTTATDLDLSALVPQLAAPRLNTTLSAAQSFGGTLRFSARPLELKTANSSLEGFVSYTDGLRGQLETDLALEDLQIGTSLIGHVRGEVAIVPGESGPLIGGTLEANGLSLAEQDAMLSGNISVNGPLSEPFISANLSGSGGASGDLYAALDLGGSEYNLSSSLKIGPLDTDINITTEASSIRGSGGLAFGDYRLAFTESAPEALRLEGRAKLKTWTLTLNPFDSRAALTGQLSSVLTQLSGKVDLQADWSADASALLSGTLMGVSAGPTELGDIALRPGETAGSVILTGDALDASVTLTGTRSWTLERLTLPLPSEFQAALQGEGNFSRARLTGFLSGNLAGEAVAVPVALAYLENRIELGSEGEFLGGALSLEATGFLDTGWRGSVNLQGSSVGGFLVDLEGALSGAFGAPEVRADYVLTRDALTASGTLQASTEAVGLSGEATSSFLDDPLSYGGTLWPEPSLSLAQREQVLELFLTEGRLDATGGLELDIGPVRAEISEAQDAWLSLFLRSVAAEGLAFKTTLPSAPLQTLPSTLSEGLFIEGAGTTEGYVLLNWEDSLRATVRSVRWLTPAGVVAVSGSLSERGTGLAGRFSGAWQGSGLSRSQAWPWLASVSSLLFDAELTPESFTLNARGSGADAKLLADLTQQTALLTADWQLPEGGATLGLKYLAATGLEGTLDFDNFPIFVSEQTGAARLDAALEVEQSILGGDATLRLDEGDLALTGRLGLATVLPPALAPERDTVRELSLELDDFDAGAVPWLADYVPYLEAPLSGFVSIDNGDLAGTLMSPLTIGEEVIPLDIFLGGTLNEGFVLGVTGTLGRSSFELDASPDTLAGLVRFENFPVHKGFEASAGPADATATLTGALRFNVPNRDFRQAYVRFASEQLQIVSDGVLTEGTLSFEIENQGLTIQEARFEGDGSWTASGEASQEQLNLRVDAQDADFSPLLSLAPQLAGLDARAFGTLQLVSSGSLINPIIRATSPGLELSLSGSAYALDDFALTVQNSDFVTSGRLDGVAPLTGSLRFSGGGQLVLAPERAFDLSLRFQGDPSLPVIGTLSNVEGVISARPGEPWRIESTGVLGQPFRLEGNLTPLDVRLSGTALNLRARQFFLVSSATDTSLRFVWDRGLFVSGSLLTKRAQLDLDAREKRGSSGESTQERSRSGALSRVFFQDVAVRAPQQITFQENFGSGELGNINLTLGGTAATPFLNGRAEALRGTVRFAGRDFALGRSVATFQPSQGIFPTLNITARTSFNKNQVLSGLSDLSFAEPAGPTFELNLVLAGSLEPSRGGPRPFIVDITPTLTSNAVVQGEAVEGGRPLTEPELFSLLSLGRLELSPQFASQGGLATAVAQGAVDTAVDLLILSELQQELGSILGLDLLEIRTSSLSSLITGEDEVFGVSLRVGGYLSDELFASYQIGSVGLDDGIALSNEFNLRYTLDPLDFTLLGTLDFRDDGRAVPALDLGIGYSLNPTVRLETGAQLSSASLGVRFGVNFRY